jgi:hypothetical protein
MNVGVVQNRESRRDLLTNSPSSFESMRSDCQAIVGSERVRTAAARIDHDGPSRVTRMTTGFVVEATPNHMRRYASVNVLDPHDNDGSWVPARTRENKPLVITILARALSAAARGFASISYSGMSAGKK